jgi:hypothetical protein
MPRLSYQLGRKIDWYPGDGDQLTLIYLQPTPNAPTRQPPFRRFCYAVPAKDAELTVTDRDNQAVEPGYVVIDLRVAGWPEDESRAITEDVGKHLIQQCAQMIKDDGFEPLCIDEVEEKKEAAAAAMSERGSSKTSSSPAGGPQQPGMSMQQQLQQLQQKPPLMKFSGKPEDFNSWEEAFVIWQLDLRELGLKAVTSDLINACPPGMSKSIVNFATSATKSGKSANLTDLVDQMKAKLLGNTQTQVFAELANFFIYRRKTSTSISEHITKVSQQKRKVLVALEAAEIESRGNSAGAEKDKDENKLNSSDENRDLGADASEHKEKKEKKDVFGTVFWGWYLLFTASLSEEALMQVKTMLRGDFTWYQVKTMLEAYFQDTKNHDKPADEAAHCAGVYQQTKKKSKKRKEPFKQRCIFGKSCKNPKCNYWHPEGWECSKAE